jgi:hypothetical protein
MTMKKEDTKNNEKISDNKPEMTKEQIGQLTMGLFAFTAIIYFMNAGYSYYKQIEGGVSMNIALGVMFLCVGLSFLVTSKDKSKSKDKNE